MDSLPSGLSSSAPPLPLKIGCKQEDRAILSFMKTRSLLFSSSKCPSSPPRRDRSGHWQSSDLEALLVAGSLWKKLVLAQVHYASEGIPILGGQHGWHIDLCF